MQVFAGNPCCVNDKMFQQDAQHFFFQVVVYLKFALQAGDDGLASCFFFFRKAEVHDAGGTVEKESATWNFVVVPVDAIEITVKKEYHVVSFGFLDFQVVKVGQGNNIVSL